MPQLTVECGVGIAVLVRCFADKKSMKRQIADRLGVGFSQPPFATVVVCLLPCVFSFFTFYSHSSVKFTRFKCLQALCTAISFLAIYPVAELFFFHIILIRKVEALSVTTLHQLYCTKNYK